MLWELPQTGEARRVADMSGRVAKPPVKVIQAIQMEFGGDFLVRSLAEGVGQVGKLALKVLEFVLYLLNPGLKEFVWVERALVTPDGDDSPISVLVAFRVVARPHVAAAPVA